MGFTDVAQLVLEVLLTPILTATTVAMVTSASGDRENAMACEWAMMVSASPLRFVIAVWPGHATHELIEESAEFGLSFCSEEQARLSHVSGSYSMHDINKWELADFRTYPAQKIRAPMIDGCLLNVSVEGRDGGPTLMLHLGWSSSAMNRWQKICVGRLVPY